MLGEGRWQEVWDWVSGWGSPWSPNPVGESVAQEAHGSSLILTACLRPPTVSGRLPGGPGQEGEGEGEGEQKEGGRGGGRRGGRAGGTGGLLPQEGQTEEQVSRWVSLRAARPCVLRARPPSPLSSVPGGMTGAGSPGRTPKKTKVEPYSLTAQQKGLIREDQGNTKLWTEILKSLKDGPVSAPFSQLH